MLVRLRAASLNHLDLWIRKGLPSVPKPRILGADGAGIREDTGERVVINPGLEHGERITVIGEHMDGTHAELIAVPETNVYPIPDELSFEEAAAFPLVFETAYRMLVTRRSCSPASGCCSGGSAAASPRRRSRSRRRWARARSSPPRATRSSSGRASSARTRRSTTPRATSRAAVKEATDGGGVDVVRRARRRGDLEDLARCRRAPAGRIAVCGATSGPNPPAALHRIWWKQLTIYGSTMGTHDDFEGAYELVKSGRAKPVIDSVLPARRGARRARADGRPREQFGKIVLTIPS